MNQKPSDIAQQLRITYEQQIQLIERLRRDYVVDPTPTEGQLSFDTSAVTDKLHELRQTAIKLRDALKQQSQAMPDDLQPIREKCRLTFIDAIAWIRNLERQALNEKDTVLEYMAEMNRAKNCVNTYKTR